MKRTIAHLLALGAIVVLANAAMAQDTDAPNGPRRGRGRGDGPGMRGGEHRGGPRRGGEGAQRLRAVLSKLDLTAEQKTQIRQILADNKPGDRDENRAKMEQLRDKMRQAREDGDREAAKAAREEMREMAQQRREAGKDIIEQIKAVLTDEQKAKFDTLIGPAGGFTKMLADVKKLDLTAEQTQSIDAIAAKAREDAKTADSPEDKGKIYRAAGKKIMDVLTHEQKRSLHRRGPGGEGRGEGRGPRGDMMEELDLTADQQAQIQAIHEEARQSVENGADPREARREARRRVMQEVLTDEQKEQFREQMRNRPGRRGKGPRGPRGPRDEAGDE